MADKQFPQGIRFYMPRENAPKFVKGVISIYAKEACEWIQANAVNGKLRIDLKEGRSGEWYLDLNDYKPRENSGDVIADNNPFQEEAPF